MELAVLGEDAVKWEKDYIAVLFHGKRRVLSTGPLNGGIHTDLQAVFNLHGGKRRIPCTEQPTGNIWRLRPKRIWA